MQPEVPWKYCDEAWSTCNCRDGTQNDSLQDPWNGTRLECLNFTYEENATVAASDEYFSNKVLQLTSGIEDMQNPKWDLSLCNLFVWLLTFLVLSKGIKSLGKGCRPRNTWGPSQLAKKTGPSLYTRFKKSRSRIDLRRFSQQHIVAPKRSLRSKSAPFLDTLDEITHEESLDKLQDV
ncbi:SLC6A6 [Mytilus edulis]|uniref:SLC6A6 n=1 Tax=Mytilus edulis TaxID=6550 RepID=A0A8S3V6I5_MYTED|nr:SLC6A6 [Mytilus edulis]